MSFNRGRPFPGRNSSKAEMTKLYVGNVPQPARKKDLQDLFEKFGKVNECDIIKNYGFVHMDNEQDANDAIKALNNTEWMGTRITVEMSKSKVRTQPGQGSRGECYRCGKMGHWSRDCPTDGGKRGRGGPYLSRSGGGGGGGGRGPPPPAYDDGYDRDRGDRYGEYMQRRLPPPPPDYYYRMRYMDPVYDRYRDRYYESRLPPPRDPRDLPPPGYRARSRSPLGRRLTPPPPMYGRRTPPPRGYEDRLPLPRREPYDIPPGRPKPRTENPTFAPAQLVSLLRGLQDRMAAK
ncbi:uncharacterized protein LOC144911642 isoform X5 [Branchiostoma floridae x Branchiostoma belcheri]